MGIVSNVARPDANVTGINILTTMLEKKRFSLLREMIPNAKKFAALVNPSRVVVQGQIAEVREASSQLGVDLVIVNAANDAEFEATFARMDQQGAGGMQVCADPFFFSRRQDLIALAARYRVPAMYEWRDFTEAGGLMSYGTDLADSYRQAGSYVARILKGAKPNDLPVMQTTRFEFVINLRTAKALGLEVPPFARPRRRGDRVSNCVVGSSGGGMPLGVVTEHGIEGYNHLAHHGDDDDFGLFASSGETIREGFERGVVAACAKGCHIENVTHGHATPIDTAVSLKLSAIEVIGRETDEGGDLLAIDLAELRQGGEERKGEGRADARHGDEQAIAVGETRIGGDKFRQPLVEEKNIGLQSHQATLAKTPQHGVLEMSRLVHGSDMLVTQLAPHGYDLGEVFNCIVAVHNACRHNRDVFCDQSRVETIILGQDTAGASELTKLVRVDASHRQSGREQRTDDAALVTTARLKANRRDREWAQPYNQLGPTGRVVAYRKAQPLGQQQNVQTVLRHINATKGKLCHLRIPSLLMRARAQATVRVWKKRLEHQAHSRRDIRDGCGLPVVTGATS